jgi:hypothetical protein
MTRLAALVLVLVLGFATPAVALTIYYVAPNSTTAHTGGPAAPWASLDLSAWSTINTKLATDDVTVYFTARKAASDTNETTTAPLSLVRTDMSTHRLTLDGMSQYNTSNSSPSWVPYNGTSRFQIASTYPVSSENFSPPFPPRNYITIRGFRIIAIDGQIAALQGMSNLIFELNEGSTNPGATVGPGVITGLTSLGDTRFPSHIIIRNNNIHDTQGECIYIGGSTPDPPGSGSPVNTGDDILIQGNTLTNCGAQGGQGDGVDVKDGHTNLRIIGNHYVMTSTSSLDNQCIVVESADLIDGNYCEGRGIAVSAAWNNPLGRNQLVIRNNILVNITAGQTGNGLQLYNANSTTYQWSNTNVYNNSLYLVAGAKDCVNINSPNANITIANNIFHSCGNGISADTAGLVTAHDYNNFFNITGKALVLGGATTSCANITTAEAHSKCLDPKYVKTSAPYVDTNFKLQAGSPAIGAGADLSATFMDDYAGATRAEPWDIGAWAVTVTAGTPPSPPTQLRLQ